MFRTGYRSTAAAPIVVAGALWGAVAIASEDPLPPDTENRLGAFCELASLAVASAQARADLTASRARVVKAGDEQRRRLERNLHDGAQQRLVSVALMLRLAKARLGPGAESAAKLLDDASRELDTRPRRAARARPRPAPRGARRPRPAARDRGADRAAADPRRSRRRARGAAARRRGGDGVLHRRRGAHQRRPPRRGDGARVTIRRDGAVLRVEISDDGIGGADAAGGTGIVGLRDRAEAAGGTLDAHQPARAAAPS